MSLKKPLILLFFLCGIFSLSYTTTLANTADPLSNAVNQATANSQNPPPVSSASFNNIVLLSGIPFIGSTTTLPQLLQALYRIAIILGAVFAVVRITIAGLQYMGSDSFGSKSDAKKAITEVLIGLLILLSTVLILKVLIGEIDLSKTLQIAPMPFTAPPTRAPAPSTGTGPAPAVDGLIPIQVSRGCNQTRGAGRTCPSGQTGIFADGGVRCHAAASIPTPASDKQTTFKSMTEGQCRQYTNPLGITTPEAWKTQVVGFVELSSLPAGMTVEQYKASIETACNAISPAGQVVDRTQYTLGLALGKYAFACSLQNS